MGNVKRIICSSMLLGLVTLVAGCVIAPREGFYDRDHHRYWHDHAWHDCVDHDEHCR